MRKRLQVLFAEPGASHGCKLAVIRAAAACSFPTGDIVAMLAEIDIGRDMCIGAG